MIAEQVTYRFKVCGNRDQLERVGLYSPEWVESDSKYPSGRWNNSRIPNRVEREFHSFQVASDMYWALKSMGLVAFKNWL